MQTTTSNETMTTSSLTKAAASKKSFYTGKPYDVSKTTDVSVAYTYFVRDNGERWNVCLNAGDDDWALFATIDANEIHARRDAIEIGRALADALGVTFDHD